MSEHPQTSHLYIKTKIFEFNIYYISVDISKSILVVVLVPVVAPLPSGAAVVRLLKRPNPFSGSVIITREGDGR